MSTYDDARMARIQANREMMKQLGLQTSPVKKKAKRTPRPRSTPTTPSLPTRRSTRGKGNSSNLVSLPELEPEVYLSSSSEEEEDSNVFQYSCKSVSLGSNGVASNAFSSSISTSIESSTTTSTTPPISPTTSTTPPTTTISHIHDLESTNTKLKRIYTMDAHGSSNLLAAGGHAGLVSVFLVGPTQAESPEKMHFKACKGWISGVRFLGESNLLVGSNDGSLTVLDLLKVKAKSMKPSVLCTNTVIHPKGVFDLDVRAGRMATASKDKTVAISSLHQASIQEISRIRVHEGVIKSVRWRNDNEVASSGKSKTILLSDTRDSPSTSLLIHDAHEFVVNCLRFHPTKLHLLLSTSFGGLVKLWDLRKIMHPVQTYRGHLKKERTTSIYQSTFLPSGHVITSGETKVCVYDLDSGRVLSKGEVNGRPITCISVLRGDVLGGCLGVTTDNVVGLYK